MPFITQTRRKIIDDGGTPDDGMQFGDLCYTHYRDMVVRWKESPRWTTAHEIFSDYQTYKGWLDANNQVAADLAWQVFFQIYVMAYEQKKRVENGDI